VRSIVSQEVCLHGAHFLYSFATDLGTCDPSHVNLLVFDCRCIWYILELVRWVVRVECGFIYSHLNFRPCGSITVGRTCSCICSQVAFQVHNRNVAILQRFRKPLVGPLYYVADSRLESLRLHLHCPFRQAQDCILSALERGQRATV